MTHRFWTFRAIQRGAGLPKNMGGEASGVYKVGPGSASFI